MQLHNAIQQNRGHWPSRRASGFLLAVAILMAVAFSSVEFWPETPSPEYSHALGKSQLAEGLRKDLGQNKFPQELTVHLGWKEQTGKVRYTLNLLLQHEMEKWIKLYSPDYAAFVALDAKTGAILTLVSFSKENEGIGNLNLKASFPAASIFKMVTAAAAIEEKKLDPNSVISFTGANHTLYKRNLRDEPAHRWTRFVTVKEAFARSINSVFGKIGVHVLGPELLEKYGRRFQFNQMINADIPVEPGSFRVLNQDPFEVAQVAAGFTTETQMSPVQGSLMAASIANEGVMMEPYLVESLISEKEGPLYHAKPTQIGTVLTKESAQSLRRLMQATVTGGTSRKSFRDFVKKHDPEEIEVGGKTGHLTGLNPKGKYDWFVGYAIDNDRRVAVAALTINEEYWKVKSSFLAKKFFENYFRMGKRLPKDYFKGLSYE